MAPFSDLVRLMGCVRNPLPILHDRMGLALRPYCVRLKDGLVVELRPGCGDRYGFYEVFLRGDYLNGGQRLSAGDTVIDVGANIGCFSLLAAKLVGPQGRVIAIEPEEATFRQLERNIELNAAARIVVPRRMAVGGVNGAVDLHTSPVALFNSLYMNVGGKRIDAQVQRVQIRTLEAIMKEDGVGRCHYLKLDCEGAEHEIIRTLPLEVASKIDQITVELHAVEGADPVALRERIRALGFRVACRKGVSYFRRIEDA